MLPPSSFFLPGFREALHRRCETGVVAPSDKPFLLLLRPSIDWCSSKRRALGTPFSSVSAAGVPKEKKRNKGWRGEYPKETGGSRNSPMKFIWSRCLNIVLSNPFVVKHLANLVFNCSYLYFSCPRSKTHFLVSSPEKLLKRRRREGRGEGEKDKLPFRRREFPRGP